MYFYTILSHIESDGTTPTVKMLFNHSSVFSNSPSWLLETPYLFSISIILSFQDCYINEVIQYITFWEWLFHSVQFPWNPSKGCSNSSSFFFFLIAPLLMAEYRSTGSKYYNLFKHWSTEGHLGYFYFSLWR